MLIDKVVHFCDDDYTNNGCIGCEQSCLCELDCSKCLDDIHYHNNQIRRDYNCERLLDYYVCRYSYKYCSEIIYALRTVDLSHYPYFNIISLGCGASPDLMAFEYMNYPQPIRYKGFDINKGLDRIHNYILSNSMFDSIDYYRECDVLELFDTNQISNGNVIIIEYLISFFYQQIGFRGLCFWFDKIAEKVVSLKAPESPMLIIINDADSVYVGRDAFPQLCKAIEEKGLRIVREYRMRFQEHDYYQGSVRHISCLNLFHIPDGFSEKYKVAINCSSAQLILEVQ